ncbi:porin [Thiopseudomonas alkaliphila]|uniref:Porin n=1 Tax=Thiopseudomonas alkaliphila TaxID=1697053 RepID=A0A0K1XGM3_9GAMM|nr:OmpA family protein [Thiopseudomonas alkaliphila]AKX60323.1 porin [Thiopseudomonas alkaliphila]
MKLKNTLGVAIASILAASSLSAFAQGQGAVEVDAFAKRYFTDSTRNMDNGNLIGGSVGYFLTDDVSLALSYGEYHDIRSKDRESKTRGRKNVKGNLTALDAAYHFGEPGVGLRPYVSAGVGHQSISNLAPRSGRDHTTFGNIGAGLKYYFTENLFAKASVEGLYGFDNHQGEWQTGLALGANFGGAPKAVEEVVVPVEPVACIDSDNDGVCDDVDLCPDTPEGTQVDANGCPIEPEKVRVELDVKFDFDKDQVKRDSYSDIQNLADFMKQFPQTATTVEGHTDSVGSEAYNQKLSERRANAVRNVLVNELGVEGNRVDSVGYGESRPVADNATREGRAINRRVEAEVEAEIQP